MISCLTAVPKKNTAINPDDYWSEGKYKCMTGGSNVISRPVGVGWGKGYQSDTSIVSITDPRWIDGSWISQSSITDLQYCYDPWIRKMIQRLFKSKGHYNCLIQFKNWADVIYLWFVSETYSHIINTNTSTGKMGKNNVLCIY